MTLSSLTKAQKEAIDHFKGSLLIVAGPGAGKTWVLVERVLSLIEKRGVNPHNILLTTFTVKAAEELKARISKRIGIKAQAIQISTVHSFCKMILEKYSDYHEYGTSVNVLSDDAKLMFLRSKYKEIGLSGHGLHNLIAFYNKCNENRINPDELINEIKKRYPDKERYIKTCISYKKYLKLLKDNNKADFSILQENALKLLEENPEVLEDVRNQYQFILVDEYQDTNPLQDKLFELISRPKCNICVVGDDDQSIYSFRGANIQNFIRFPKRYENTKIIKLDKNFRSTINIINASEDFIAKNRYLQKEINPWREEGNKVVLLENNNDEDEAKNVVKLIKKMKEKGIIPHYGYVTLLFRSVKYQAGEIVAELKENNIPFEVIGDASFLKRDEIRTMLYLLSYVDPPDYDGKFKGKWRDWWKISMFENEFLNLTEDTKTFLQKLEKTADLSELLEPADFKKIGIEKELDIIKLSKLNQLKNELYTNKKSLLTIFYEIIEISGYLKWLLEEGSPQSDEKLFNLAKLSSIINQYEDLTENPSIEDFLRYFYKLPKKMYYDEVIYEDPHSLKIMTVHKAKGLEFPVVIICSVVKDKFPMKSWKDRDPVPIPEHLLIYGNEDTTDEERRLFYVAMTRAQDNLIISTSKNKDTNNLSFIDEIGIKKFSDISALIENCKDREIVSNPINISYSAINAYTNCPFMYKLVYFYFLEYKPTHMQNYGTILHNCLNRIHLAIKNNETINEDIITGIVEKCWIDLYKTGKEEKEEKNKLKLKLFKYYSSMHDHIKEIISTEEQFSIYSNGMLISGRTDLIIKNKDDKLELIDFKARGESGIEKTYVETQLRVYEYALQDKYEFDRLCAYKFQDNQKTYFEPNGKDQKISQEIEEICKKIENENYEPIKTSLCSQCFFKFCCG